MKKYMLVLISVCVGITRLSAQTYPSWDDSNPGPLPFAGVVDGNNNCVSTNGVFCVANGAPDPFPIYRWTACGGWEEIPNCTIAANCVGRADIHANRRMAFHDHYIYLTGFLYVNGSTNPVPVARFDMNTGSWTPLGSGMDLSYRVPYTIAVDSLNRIYVGFYEYSFGDGDTGFDYMTGYAGQTVTNLLIVSTNNGVSWNTVGGGLTVETLSSGFVDPAITALYADGTNLYVGGDFTSAAGQPANSSKRVIMWTGNAWRNLDGVYCATQFNGHGTGPGTGDDALVFGGYNFNLDSVNSIVGIGTNIYVAGVFDTPQMGIARFSNVTGQSLPIDGLSDNHLFTWGSSLAVNNGHLYLAGSFVAPNLSTNYVCLLDPEASHPTLWTNAFPESIDGTMGVEVSTTAGANAIYVVTDGSDFKRLMLASDGPSPSAQITRITNSTLTATGTARSHWQVIYSVDNTNWYTAGSMTLWGGTGVFNLSAYGNPLPQYWKLTNNCSASPEFNLWRDINVQFPASVSQPTKSGAAVVGSDGDYWNIADVLDGEEPPIGDPGSTTYEVISCKDNLQVPTSVSVSLATLGDPPMGVACGAGSGSYDAATDPLMLGFDTSGSGNTMTLTISGLDPRGTYDVYLYGLWQNSVSRSHTQFQLVTGLPDATTSSSNPQSTDSGTGWDINTWQLDKQYALFHLSFTSPNSGSIRNVKFTVGTFGTFAIINGLQIVRTN